MYHIPRTLTSTPSNSGNRYAFYYRKDYAKALGYDFTQPVTWEMLADYLNHAVTDDPNGNGADDTTGLTLLAGGQRVMFDTLYESYGVREWMYEDGRWIPGLLSHRSKEMTYWLKKLYENGAIDRDYFNTTAKASSEKFATGRVAVLLAPADLKSAGDDFRMKYWSVIHPTLPIEDYVGL
ncbi:MAG: extracellular solute-binding protein, partial [Angelakisella sp.]